LLAAPRPARPYVARLLLWGKHVVVLALWPEARVEACSEIHIAAALLCRYSFPMSSLLERITVNPKQCGGRPCIRGMRIRVVDVLDLFAAGLDAAQILDEMPDLEADDLKACLMDARRRIDHPLLAA
jgi:uncharacterized protein (DUF433 family)